MARHSRGGYRSIGRVQKPCEAEEDREPQGYGEQARRGSGDGLRSHAARNVSHEHAQLQRALGDAGAQGGIHGSALRRLRHKEHGGDGEHGVGNGREGFREEDGPQVGPGQEGAGGANGHGDGAEERVKAGPNRVHDEAGK